MWESHEEFKQSTAWLAMYWFSEGYSFGEIGHELNQTEAFVYQALQRCRWYLGAADNNELVVKALISGLIIKQRDLDRGVRRY